MIHLVACMSSVFLCGVMSSWRFTAEYVIILTGREQKGRLMGQNIYRATDYDILPLNPDVSVANPPNAVEAHLLALVRSHLNGGYFLFSYGWDLTRRLQAQWLAMESDQEKSLWEAVRPRLHVCSAVTYSHTTRPMTSSSGIGMPHTAATLTEFGF